MSLLTIAIPTYNRENYLRDCLKSILVQTFTDFEIIIFDNHSDYNIVSLIDEFNDSRITLSQNETNIGNVGNFNKIFNFKYDSKYLIVFHDDDTMHPKLLQKEIDVLESDLRYIENDVRGLL